MDSFGPIGWLRDWITQEGRRTFQQQRRERLRGAAGRRGSFDRGDEPLEGVSSPPPRRTGWPGWEDR